ncbi:hypothetical protein [Parvularcula maris]|uniref:Uncharacterized protein n=1 Tax=Parvularcula maris TaxID=2965077 RepID=A0A9X2RGS4_9PROT|nr:hypothetical protein [Parvularcula maris]MCQ8184200.1 hypothetical protein [Parvularcula maris]
MIDETKCKPSRSTIAVSAVWLLVTLTLLAGIILEPDEGGIWDGYTPTWLGGEGESR